MHSRKNPKISLDFNIGQELINSFCPILKQRRLLVDIVKKNKLTNKKDILKKYLQNIMPYLIITLAFKIYAPLAQLAEHLTLNQGVQGSNPWRRTIKGSNLQT